MLRGDKAQGDARWPVPAAAGDEQGPLRSPDERGRVQGRSEIERTFKAIFDAYPPRSNRPPTPIAPQDLLIQEYDGHAVVTFQLGSETARQRRTLALKRMGAEWKIVHLHGSAAADQR